MLRKHLLLILLIAVCYPYAYGASDDLVDFNIHRIDTEIQLDGIVQEKEWQQAPRLSDFTQNYPTDTLNAQSKTEVWIMHNEQFLYVAAKCYDELDGDYVVQSLKRDFSYPATDAFAIFLNPSGDRINGFSFAVNPYGAQREGLLADGGGFGVTTAWDNKWFSAVSRQEDYWSVEMAIPFKTLRYDRQIENWTVNFGRQDLKRNESSTWKPVKLRFNVASLAYAGVMNWPEPPPKTGSNISIIPYIKGGAKFDYQESEQTAIDNLANVGLDAKVAVSTSLNLDLTVNPDFSQVEVDQQVIDLDRFSIFFPERRHFFLENSDLFSSFGFRQIRPFFSRRIGLTDGFEIPILGGARLSGNLNGKTRIGLMNVHSASLEEEDILANNFSVAAVQRQVFGRSNISGIMVNRQGFDEGDLINDQRNTVLGADFNLFSNNNKWRGKVFYHHSFTGGAENKRSFANASWLMYQTSKVRLMWNHEHVMEDYNAEVGFVRRTGYFRLEPIANYFLYPNAKSINNIRLGLYQSYYWKPDWQKSEHLVNPSVEINFMDYSEISLEYRNLHVLLEDDFEVFGEGNPVFEANDYFYDNWRLAYQSDFRKTISGSSSIRYGKFFAADQLSVNGQIKFRLSRFGAISLSSDWKRFNYTEENFTEDLTLVGLRTDLSLSTSVFLSTFVQYNTQADNININSRFQWRFAPMSDLFIVYTDNYTTDFGAKNKAFVLKLNYWFSL